MSGALSRLNEPSLNRSRVPSEFTGMARTLRAKLMAEHCRWEPCAAELLRLSRVRNGFRRPKCSRMAELWSALPGTGARIALASEAKRASLKIAELRIFPARLRFHTWPPDADELSVSVASVTLGLRGNVFYSDITVLADVGLHALARRYQRGAERSDQAILHDLGALAGAYAATVAAGGKFNIAGWLGEMYHLNDVPILSVRTYINPPEEGSVP